MRVLSMTTILLLLVLFISEQTQAADAKIVRRVEASFKIEQAYKCSEACAVKCEYNFSKYGDFLTCTKLREKVTALFDIGESDTCELMCLIKCEPGQLFVHGRDDVEPKKSLFCGMIHPEFLANSMLPTNEHTTKHKLDKCQQICAVKCEHGLLFNANRAEPTVAQFCAMPHHTFIAYLQIKMSKERIPLPVELLAEVFTSIHLKKFFATPAEWNNQIEFLLLAESASKFAGPMFAKRKALLLKYLASTEHNEYLAKLKARQAKELDEVKVQNGDVNLLREKHERQIEKFNKTTLKLFLFCQQTQWERE